MRDMEYIRYHCLAKVLSNDDRKALLDITGFDFVNYDGTYDTIPDEIIQNMPEDKMAALFEKYGILGVRTYDGKHAIADGIMPEPNVQLSIDCKEPVGGAATLGRDGKWYWTYDLRLDIPCEFTVTHWQYLG